MAPIPDKYRAPDYYRIGLIREPCEYHASEYLWGRHQQAHDGGPTSSYLGYMRYALRGQGLDNVYETPDVAAGFKAWLKLIHHLNGPNAPPTCGVLGARLWTQVINRTAAATINHAPLNRPKSCVAHGRNNSWRKPCDAPCPIGDCMFQASDHLRTTCREEVEAFDDAFPFDCWLRVDRMEDDFVECMSKYDRGGGLGERAKALITNQRQVNHMNGRPSCAQMYYDKEAADLVYALDGGAAKLFGYTGGCCQPHPSSHMPVVHGTKRGLVPKAV